MHDKQAIYGIDRPMNLKKRFDRRTVGPRPVRKRSRAASRLGDKRIMYINQ